MDRIRKINNNRWKNYIYTNNRYSSSTIYRGTTNSTVQKVQLEQGSTATEYEEYVDPKIYVKNDNDVYEEFISKNNLVNYSTNEAKIGNWIDGKPLYRKIFKVSTPAVETDGTYVYLATDTTNLNIDFGFVKYACLQDDKYTFPLPYTNSSGYSVKAYYSQNFKNFEIASNGKAYNGYYCFVELNYTKTTD